jgi:hydroxyacylglutathione hydrolase
LATKPSGLLPCQARFSPATGDSIAGVKQVADGVWQLAGFPPNAINVYLVEDVLIDAATRHAGRRILRQLRGRDVNAHALTHAHPDHQGSSKEVCEELGIPYWVPERDAPAAERPELIGKRQPQHPIAQFFARTMTGPGRRVDRALREGDEVAGFNVIDVPGHSAGHVAYWRESDRVLILGDVLNNMDVMTGIPGLREPKVFLTPDPDENRCSAKKLRPLEPRLVLFGHGAPLRDTKKFVDFVERLPD